MVIPKKPETSSAPGDSLAAYEAIRAEIDAVPADELRPVNIDIMVGVTTVLGALPKLVQLRPQFALLQDFDLEGFDKLETKARALGHAHTLHLSASPSPEIAEIAEDGADLRETLVVDVSALARRGLVDGDALKSLKGPVGYRNLAFDLAALSNLLRRAWPEIQGKCGLEESDIERARALADQLLTAVGLRQFDAPVQTESALRRTRAFTLFVRSYDQVRRAVSYLRWDEGDADEFAPSLYERRHVKKANELVAPSPSPVAPPANGAAPARVAPGLPGDEPFEGR